MNSLPAAVRSLSARAPGGLWAIRQSGSRWWSCRAGRASWALCTPSGRCASAGCDASCRRNPGAVRRARRLPAGRYGQTKTDPAIYRLNLERIGLPVERCVFVNDHAVNLPPAAEPGITTFHATGEDAAVAELSSGTSGSPCGPRRMTQAARSRLGPKRGGGRGKGT
ncbi:HAD-IA family hydrolase [Streptomyces sp. NPDC057909]|uniref:HAD-IA family hydrolase n=1 Tax=Streptomyces sp. NPDC057909 TaxID=3346277 RepID=UPI0036EB774D